MASVNIVLLAGNLTREVELTYTGAGTAMAKFGMAMNEKYKKGDEWVKKPIFVDITVWGRQAETCQEFLSKGSPCIVEGKLNFSQWEQEDGTRRSKIDVTANRVQFLGRATKGEKAEPDDDVPF